MSLDLAALDAVPTLGVAQSHLRNCWANVHRVKACKRRCSAVLEQCVALLIALHGCGSGDNSKSKEITSMMEDLDKKISDWAALGPLQSFLRRQDIKLGIHEILQNIDIFILKFNVNLEHRHPRSHVLQERDNADIRDLLQIIVGSKTEIQTLLRMSEQALYEVMETLQTELYDSLLVEPTRNNFAKALWFLHEETNKLPPLTDLTGQVKFDGVLGNNYPGEWLGMKVELRALRSPANISDVRQRYEREVKKWRQLRHDNVISVYGVVYGGVDMFTVQPWMDNGTAVDVVRRNPDVNRLKMLNDIASGLEYLHKENIVHGDLRGATVLIDANGCALLSDFGITSFTRKLDNGTVSPDTTNSRWFAPELLRNNCSVSTQSDVWSFAMVCLELITGEPPFSKIAHDITVLRELEQGKTPDRPGPAATVRGLSDELWALMRKCWHRKPESRPSAATVKSRLLHQRDSGSSSQKKPFFSLRRPRTADGNTPKPESHLRVPSLPSPRSAADLNPSLTMGDIMPRHPASPGTVDYSIRSGPSQLDDLALQAKFGSLYLADRSTPSLFPDTDSELQSVVSGSSQYSLQDSLMLLNATPTGDVFAGNLEGFVDRLLSPDAPQHSEFQEVILSTCYDWTTPEHLLAIIVRRFSEAGLNPKASAELQLNVFGVLTFWLSSSRLQVHAQLLSQIEQFCWSVVSTKASSLNENARRLLQLARERANMDNALASPLVPSSTKIPRTADILPRDLAIALALLEGDKYSSILPADYIRHLRKLEGPNRVDAASVENNRIILWVKKSVLTPSRVETRAEVLKFFVNAAHECRKFRNFASLSAITNALQSTPIERLTLTVGALSPHLRDMLQDLKNLLDPSNNHLTYRAALKPEEALDPKYKEFCIPWLAVHLRDLHSLLENYPPKVQVDGRSLINFHRYSKFMEHVRCLSLFKPPDLERYRHNGQLAYLQHQLRGLHFDSDPDAALMERSLELEADETRIHRTRALELKRLGFRS
ncbi:ras guanine nucleotide exchange factor domain-containing protein [Mycena latifolia]|nr:ras guanine nucleotide exchange factor domain-containing protein [Mycena latifolia]